MAGLSTATRRNPIVSRTQVACLLSVTLLSTVVAGAAPSPASGISERLARILGELPADQVPTGILYDRVLALAPIEEHDGSPGSAPANLRAWRQMLHEISRASLAAPSWPQLEAVEERAERKIRRGVVPLAVMNFRYDRIHPDALETGALVVENGRLRMGAGDPFVTRRVVAAAALRDYTYRGGDLAFRLDREDYLSNDTAAPHDVEIDFDDGHGFVPVTFGAPHPVRYLAAGRKTIRLRMTLAGGSPLHASFPFNVRQLVTPAPDDTLHVTASIPYNGAFGTGDAYVYLSDAHTELTEPVVVIEGFDIDNSMDWDELYALLNQEQLIEDLRSRGFDAVVLNFTDAVDYIQRNAFVAVELIQQVQAAVGPERTMALIGASMGGLVGRYALAYMEEEALPHAVRTFISFDSPQSGAAIPLGIQYWLWFFADQSPEAAALLAALDNPGARQMLAYHHTDPPGGTGEADPLRLQLLADLTTIGEYPAGTRKVAIANGNGARLGQGFNPGEQIIEWEYSSALVDIIGNVWAVPDGESATIFHGLIDFILFPPDEILVNVAGTRPFDSAPGGWRDSMAEMDATQAPFGDIVALHPNHCFIPSISALAVETSDLFYDIAGDPNLLDHTPFDAVYFPLENQEHVMITPENAAWFTAEIESGVTGVASVSRSTPLVARVSPCPMPAPSGSRCTTLRAGRWPCSSTVMWRPGSGRRAGPGRLLPDRGPGPGSTSST
jgi:hypothetical protein